MFATESAFHERNRRFVRKRILIKFFVASLYTFPFSSNISKPRIKNI